MEFYIVFVKNKKKLDKYIKVNKIRNKAIIDIKQQLEDHGLEDVTEWRDYFNLMIYTKIRQALNKNKDVYYIPNLNKINNLEIDEILQIKENLKEEINFNLLFLGFYNDMIQHLLLLQHQQYYQHFIVNTRQDV